MSVSLEMFGRPYSPLVRQFLALPDMEEGQEIQMFYKSGQPAIGLVDSAGRPAGALPAELVQELANPALAALLRARKKGAA
jgi:hypothetical protein